MAGTEVVSPAIGAGVESRSVIRDRRIELIAVNKLKPNTANARTHSRKQIRQIADCIKRFGFNNPVLADDYGQIIAGHGRVEAAKLLGLTEVPTLRLSHLSAAEKRAYVIADNRVAEKAGWDRQILAVELQGLIEVDFDVELTGFAMGEIDILLTDASEARRESASPEDKIPESTPGLAVSRIGDLWELGQHRLLCGDARRGHRCRHPAVAKLYPQIGKTCRHQQNFRGD
jgi:ParB-like chromosome segregation protein Spo0J